MASNFELTLQAIDSQIAKALERLGVDRFLNYGLAERVLEFEGRNVKAQNAVRNFQKRDEVVPVVVDDRYDVIWHHRRSNVRVREVADGAYGSAPNGIYLEHYSVANFAVSFKIENLFEVVTPIIGESPYATIYNANFESSVVYSQEYNYASTSDHPFPTFTFFQVQYYVTTREDSLCCPEIEYP